MLSAVVALVVGLALAFIVAPGVGMNINTAALDGKALSSYADNAHRLQGGGIGSHPVSPGLQRCRREELGA